ncbi:MAG: agmatine deiminase family protein [Muribaculaceae bacterium]|nr:agmatine deiminase family protein [Muribaculaceae bacterium]
MISIRLRAEWEPQSAILVAWPHAGTDWVTSLNRVQACYRLLAEAITRDEDLIVVTPEPDAVRQQLAELDADRIHIYAVPTNDTWTRDYGPLAIDADGVTRLLGFTFNAWGMKFASDLDNLVTRRLHALNAWPFPLDNHCDMVLEGGSIESDGHGTIMTTTACLLSPNRNAAWDKTRIEQELKKRFGAKQVLWVEHGYVPGDDTDSHIDTIARFAPGHVIVHATAHEHDEEYAEMRLMAEQLRSFTDADGQPYRIVALPAPDNVFDEDGKRIPATYANFLITNNSVLAPTYGCRQDEEALHVLSDIFPNRTVKGIDCRALIEQHGSLHCATMQLPAVTQ